MNGWKNKYEKSLKHTSEPILLSQIDKKMDLRD